MQHLIATSGYAAIFVLMLAESACIPVPSEVTMLLGGAIASGAVPGAHLNIVAVIVVGTLSNVAGSYLAWAVGRTLGPAAVHRYGHYLRLRDDDLIRAQRWFDHRGGASVFAGRLLPVVRTFISLPAGVAAMPAGRFGVYTTAGCLPWTAALAGAGYAIGANWNSVATGFHTATYILAAAVVITVITALVTLWRRRTQAPKTTSAPADLTRTDSRR